VRVLAISPNVPFPPIGGGLLRTYHLLRSLAARHDLTLAAFTYGEKPALPPFPVRVLEVPWAWPAVYRELHSSDPRIALAAFRKLADELPEPRFVSVAESPGMERTLTQLCEETFDVVLVEHTVMARFLPCLPQDAPKVLDLHNVHGVMARQAAAAAPAGERQSLTREADRTLEFERQAVSRCAVCLTVSKSDASAAKSLLLADDVRVVPNGVDASFFRPTDQPREARDLLFTGLMSYAPNLEAVQYFVAEILPIILSYDASFRLHVVGKNPSEQLKQLASDNVVVHGFVADIRPHYDAAAIVVVPLRKGGGTRIKVLEAAASGKAIVTTPIGVEGLEFVHGRDLLVAESPSDFAQAVLRLSDNIALRTQLGLRARQIALRYDWNPIGAEFCKLIECLG
jgi:glycosyltransferase involved in cell wall biosynthesis